MNKEQLLETLKGLTTALEAATDTPNEESLHQAFLCGARFVLDDLNDLSSLDYGVNINAEDDEGSSNEMRLQLQLNMYRSFMHEAGFYDSDPTVQAEKYCERRFSHSEIREALQNIKLIPIDIQPQNPTA